MARPILLIGLGGFGKWVVTAFKTRILDAYKVKPDDVDWISFDLARQEIPPVQFTRFELGRAKQETLDFSDTSQEFRLFGGDFAYHVGRAREGQHDPRFLGRMTKDDADILVYAHETGVPAAERRHASMIQFQLNLDAIDRVIQQKLKPDSMVFLVNSIAGGTGTGTFIDFSLLLRRSLTQTKGTLISILLLPQGFARVKQNEDMRPLLGNCYAAFRELLRLQYPKGNVQLCFSQTDLALKLVTRPAGISLADLVYVIDGSSLPENTEYYRGVVPAIAGFIEQSFLAAAYENELVAKGTIAATSFDQGMKHALENFSGVGAIENPFNAFAFSSFGTHRMVFDRDAVKTEFAHEIATRMFGQFLADSWLADPEFAVKQYTLEPKESTRFDKEVVHDCVTKLAGSGATLATYRGLRQRLEDDVKFPEFDLAGIEPAGRLSETKALADKREEFRLGQPGERFAGQARPTFHAVCDYYLARYTTQFRERLAAHVLQILGNGRGTPDYGHGSLRAAEHFVGALLKWYTLFVRGFPEAGVKARFAEACELADAAEGRLSAVESTATGFYEQNRNARGGLFRDRRKEYLGQRDGVANLRSREVLRELVRQVAQDNLGSLELLHQDLMDWIGTFKHCVDNLKDAKNDLLEVRRARQEIVCDEYLTTSGDEIENRLFELVVNDDAWNALTGPGAAKDAQTARWRETARPASALC